MDVKVLSSTFSAIFFSDFLNRITAKTTWSVSRLGKICLWICTTRHATLNFAIFVLFLKQKENYAREGWTWSISIQNALTHHRPKQKSNIESCGYNSETFLWKFCRTQYSPQTHKFCSAKESKIEQVCIYITNCMHNELNICAKEYIVWMKNEAVA